MEDGAGLSLKSGPLELRIDATGKIVRLDFAAQDGPKPLLVERPEDAVSFPRSGVGDEFTIRDAWGYDECFPSVAGSSHLGVRDHGDLWGREARSRREGSSIQTLWELPFGFFAREVEAVEPKEGRLGGFDFRVRFPRFVRLSDGVHCRSLYAAHALFAIETGDVLRILESDSAGERDAFFAEFPHAAQREARKLYFSFSGGMVARLFRKALGVDVVVSGAAGHLGLWWCNNGWGDGREHRTVGIEPTNLPSDGPVLVAPSAESGSEEELRFRISVWKRGV